MRALMAQCKKKAKLPIIKLLSETRWICNDLAVDSFATSTPCVSLAMCTDYREVSVPHRLMQSPNLSIIDVRDLISDTKSGA